MWIYQSNSFSKTALHIYWNWTIYEELEFNFCSGGALLSRGSETDKSDADHLHNNNICSQTRSVLCIMGAWLKLLSTFGFENLLFYGTFALTTGVFWSVRSCFNCQPIRSGIVFIRQQVWWIKPPRLEFTERESNKKRWKHSCQK